MLIDDVCREDLVSRLATPWRAVTGQVMGGVSTVKLRSERLLARRCLHLEGDVSLANNGGFVQMTLDLDTAGGTIDVSEFRGLRLIVHGNAETYSAHLRTADLLRSWQSYRAHFEAPPGWREIQLAFASFKPHRTDVPLNLTGLRRLGLVAIGREFCADLRVARVELYA